MIQITAKGAKLIAEQYLLRNTLDPILEKIKKESSEGKFKVYINESLSDSCLKELESEGFEIYQHPSIDIQKDNLWYTIKW
jgi:ribosomal protein S3AE